MESAGDELIKEYIRLLDDAQDYLECGYRRPKPDVIISRVERERPRSEKTVSEKIVSEKAGQNETLSDIAREIARCRKCGLCETRNKTVPGEGVENPLVMCIGEAPGGEEDRTGQPFVGKAGQYLDKWLNAVQLKRDSNCFIGNIIKCRPPGNRDPLPEEIEACRPYLLRQLKLIRPKMILTLGRIASQILANSDKGIGALRGSTFTFMDIPCVPTYHPSAVLRNQDYRKPVWDDLRRLKASLDKETHD